MGSAGAGQTRHTLLLSSQTNAEEIGDDLIHVLGVDGTEARLDLTLDQHLRERATPWRAAGTAVGVGQQVLDLVDAWILEDVEMTIRHDQDRGQHQPQHGHESNGDECRFHRLYRSENIVLPRQERNVCPGSHTAESTRSTQRPHIPEGEREPGKSCIDYKWIIYLRSQLS